MRSSGRIIFFLGVGCLGLLIVNLLLVWKNFSTKKQCIPRLRYQRNGSLIEISQRYLINTCLAKDQCYGWGDRQRAIVSTYLIALLSDRKFGIYMTNPCRLERFLIPNRVNWIVNMNELDGLCSKDFYMLNDNEKNFRQHRMIESADFNQLLLEDVIYFHTAQDYVTAIRRNKLTADKIKWLHGHTLSKVYGYVLRHLFNLTNDTRNTVEELFSKYVKNKNLICAHIRMGDPWGNTVRTLESEVNVIWDFLRGYSNVSRYKIYVATDTNDTKVQATRLFGDQIIDSIGTIGHLEISNSCEVLRTVIVEQELLTRCNVLMLTKSSLSVIAAYMRNSNKGLYCYFQTRVFPCSMEILHELYEAVL